MGKKSERKPAMPAGLILAYVCYGGVLGYAVGQANAEKAARRRANELAQSKRLRDMEAALHKLQHPESYDEHGNLKPMSTMAYGFGMGIGGIE